MIGALFAAFVIGLLLAAIVYELTGCSNGHVWDDGTPRWEIVPYSDKDRYGVTGKMVYRCQCEGCLGEKTESGTFFEIESGSIDDAIDSLKEYDYDPREQ